ncbi:MAG: lipid-A-disaccharide synthase, partial [Deinococcus-Thermus bacterium]|nr:lipid-A-disaccharide synthase [Deinococcota bacterium]
MTAPPTLLLISNGHGEDVVAARLARAFAEVRPDLRIRALPTVGDGGAYGDGPALRIGPLRRLPSGGMTMRGVAAFVADVRAGLVATTLAQVRDLRAVRADLTVAVGDAWCEALGLLPRAPLRYAVQTIVPGADRQVGSAVGIGALRERFTPLEVVLVRAAYRRVYVRDAAA